MNWLQQADQDRRMNDAVDAVDARMALRAETARTLQMIVDELTVWQGKPPKNVRVAATELLRKINGTCEQYGITPSMGNLPRRP